MTTMLPTTGHDEALRLELEQTLACHLARLMHPDSLKAFDMLDKHIVRVYPAKSSSRPPRKVFVYPAVFIQFVALMSYYLWYAPPSADGADIWQSWTGGPDAIAAFSRLKHPMPRRYVAFVQHLVCLSNLHPMTVLHALLLIAKLRRQSKFDDIAGGSEYRIFSVALLLAHSASDDHFYELKSWNRQCRMFSLSDFKAMHREFLEILKYRVLVGAEEMCRWILLMTHAQRCFLDAAALVDSERASSAGAVPPGCTPLPALASRTGSIRKLGNHHQMDLLVKAGGQPWL